MSRLVAVRALVVDALDEATASFYEHVGFTRLVAGSPRLRLLVKDLEGLAREQRERGARTPPRHLAHNRRG